MLPLLERYEIGTENCGRVFLLLLESEKDAIIPNIFKMSLKICKSISSSMGTKGKLKPISRKIIFFFLHPPVGGWS